MAFPSAPWVAGTTYALNAMVNYQGLDYISLQNANLGKAPATNGTWWSLFTDWAAGTTYAANNKITRSGIGYVSVVGTNLNHDPATAANIGPWWERLAVKAGWAPPPDTGSLAHQHSVMIFQPAPRQAVPAYTEPGTSPLQGHIGTIFTRQLISTPLSSPGPTSVWSGRVVFRVLKPGWFFGLGQRANQMPVSHNSGE